MDRVLGRLQSMGLQSLTRLSTQHPHLGTQQLLKLRTQVRRQTWFYSLDSVIRAVCSTQTFEHFLCTRHCVGYLVI